MIAPEPCAAARDASPLKFVGVQPVPLHFTLGELRLLSPTLPLAVVEVEPGRELPAAWRSTLPPPGPAGYLFRGLPASAGRLAAETGWHCAVLRAYPRHVVDLSTSYEAYLAKFSSKTRSTLKRKLRRFEALSGGAIRCEEFRTKEDVGRFLPQARKLSAKTYQERLLDAGLPDGEAFTADALSLAARGDVRAYILFLSGRPVSYLYLPVEGTRVIYAYLGYDPAYADYSPGTVLQLLAMERLFAEPGLKVFDFTEGAGSHKQLFATHTYDCVDIVLVTRSARTILFLRAHAAFAAFESRLAAALDRWGVKARMKKLLRGFFGAAKA
jgi:CelD/BcsL family acetyltransferase involved in cellulose biosynthesis